MTTRERPDLRPTSAARRGQAAIAFWALGALLFVAPFLRAPSRPDWDAADPTRITESDDEDAVLDIPFAEEVAYFDEIAREEGWEIGPLAEHVDEASARFFGRDADFLRSSGLVELGHPDRHRTVRQHLVERRRRPLDIRMHAHGDADDLKIDLTSDPALAQDDIFLLITVGLTRAELDQAKSASVGESVALEALGTLSGADRAVTQAVPVIDEFRFGSSYSSRTGRTEPTVTVGKRLTERVRANVTTGLSESREVRSNIEWQLSNRVSVESSYDNVNDISSSALGNLGADVRWRLEFE